MCFFLSLGPGQRWYLPIYTHSYTHNSEMQPREPIHAYTRVQLPIDNASLVAPKCNEPKTFLHSHQYRKKQNNEVIINNAQTLYCVRNGHDRYFTNNGRCNFHNGHLSFFSLLNSRRFG